MKQPEFTYRYFWNGVPFEELDAETRAELPHRLARRMGDALNRYFGLHPEEYIAFAATLPEAAG